MLVWIVAVAHADGNCRGAPHLDYRLDGATDVPTDAWFPYDIGDIGAEAELLDAEGRLVPSDPGPPLRPLEPLVPGASYRMILHQSVYGDALFTVGPGPTAPIEAVPEIVAIEVDGDYVEGSTGTCGGIEPGWQVGVVVQVNDADVLSQLRISRFTTGLAAVDAGEQVLREDHVPESGETCFEAILVDAAGHEWPSEPSCVELGELPSNDAGGGCATSPDPRGLGALALAMVLLARRGRRAA